MSAHILALATALPAYRVAQSAIAARLSDRLNLSEAKRSKLCRIFDHSAIETRYISVPDFDPDAICEHLYPSDLTREVPGTEARNRVYKEKALPLAVQSAQRALAQWGRPASDITHVVSVSCTGMMAPGLEFLLIDALGLPRDVKRLGLNFMGCFGAMRGLAMAKAITAESSEHRTLLVCTELCSLHFQADHAIDTFIGNALFSDGAAAAVIGGPASTESPSWELVKQHCLALADSQQDMTWECTDHGFVMRLSQAVPNRLSESIKVFVEELVAPHCTLDECCFAVHPGGKSILHKLTEALGLQREDLAASWHVMQHYGNMSSPTVLFILKEVEAVSAKRWAVCLAFGPGLSIEGFLLRRSDAAVN